VSWVILCCYESLSDSDSWVTRLARSLAGWVRLVGCRRRRQKIRRQTLHWWQSVRRLSRYINWTLLSCLKVSVQRTRSNKHTQSVQCLYFFAVQFCIFCVLGFSGYTETQCLCLSVCSVIVVMRLPTQTDCLLVSLSVCLSVSLCASISLSVCLSVSVEILSWWDCLPRPTVCLSRQTEGPTWTRWHRFWWQLFTRYCSQTTSARTRSVSLSVCLSLSLSLCVSLSLSVCLSLSLSVCVTLSVCLSVCLSLCVCHSLCLSVTVDSVSTCSQAKSRQDPWKKYCQAEYFVKNTWRRYTL